MIIGGIDEAGRGCIIGSMVIAGIEAEEDYVSKWAEWGVKDSKQLTPEKREELYEKLAYPWIGGGATYRVIIIEPQEIDAAVYFRRKRRKRQTSGHGQTYFEVLSKRHRQNPSLGLNHLEAVKMAELIDMLPEAKVFYIDSPDRKVERFGSLIYSLSHARPKIIARNYADRDFTVVGAASIMAKVTRDTLLQKLKEKAGEDFGSGYTDDPKTRDYVKRLLMAKQPLPSWVRKSWKTIRLLKGDIKAEQESKEMLLPGLDYYIDKQELPAD